MVLLLPWYCMVTIGSGLVTGLVNPPLVFVVHGHLVFCCSEHVSPKKTSRKYQAKLIQKGQLNKKPSTFVQPGLLSPQKWLFRICRKCKRQQN